MAKSDKPSLRLHRYVVAIAGFFVGFAVLAVAVWRRAALDPEGGATSVLEVYLGRSVPRDGPSEFALVDRSAAGDRYTLRPRGEAVCCPNADPQASGAQVPTAIGASCQEICVGTLRVAAERWRFCVASEREETRVARAVFLQNDASATTKSLVFQCNNPEHWEADRDMLRVTGWRVPLPKSGELTMGPSDSSDMVILDPGLEGVELKWAFQGDEVEVRPTGGPNDVMQCPVLADEATWTCSRDPVAIPRDGIRVEGVMVLELSKHSPAAKANNHVASGEPEGRLRPRWLLRVLRERDIDGNSWLRIDLSPEHLVGSLLDANGQTERAAFGLAHLLDESRYRVVSRHGALQEYVPEQLVPFNYIGAVNELIGSGVLRVEERRVDELPDQELRPDYVEARARGNAQWKYVSQRVVPQITTLPLAVSGTDQAGPTPGSIYRPVMVSARLASQAQQLLQPDSRLTSVLRRVNFAMQEGDFSELYAQFDVARDPTATALWPVKEPDQEQWLQHVEMQGEHPRRCWTVRTDWPARPAPGRQVLRALQVQPNVVHLGGTPPLLPEPLWPDVATLAAAPPGLAQQIKRKTEPDDPSEPLRAGKQWGAAAVLEIRAAESQFAPHIIWLTKAEVAPSENRRPAAVKVVVVDDRGKLDAPTAERRRRALGILQKVGTEHDPTQTTIGANVDRIVVHVDSLGVARVDALTPDKSDTVKAATPTLVLDLVPISGQHRYHGSVQGRGAAATLHRPGQVDVPIGEQIVLEDGDRIALRSHDSPLAEVTLHDDAGRFAYSKVTPATKAEVGRPSVRVYPYEEGLSRQLGFGARAFGLDYWLRHARAASEITLVPDLQRQVAHIVGNAAASLDAARPLTSRHLRNVHAVVMDYDTGEVLAASEFPGFRPEAAVVDALLSECKLVKPSDPQVVKMMNLPYVRTRATAHPDTIHPLGVARPMDAVRSLVLNGHIRPGSTMKVLDSLWYADARVTHNRLPDLLGDSRTLNCRNDRTVLNEKGQSVAGNCAPANQGCLLTLSKTPNGIDELNSVAGLRPDDGRFIHCLGTHGDLAYVTAMAKSCNLYFSRLRLAMRGVDWRRLRGQFVGLDTGFSTSNPNIDPLGVGGDLFYEEAASWGMVTPDWAGPGGKAALDAQRVRAKAIWDKWRETTFRASVELGRFERDGHLYDKDGTRAKEGEPGQQKQRPLFQADDEGIRDPKTLTVHAYGYMTKVNPLWLLAATSQVARSGTFVLPNFVAGATPVTGADTHVPVVPESALQQVLRALGAVVQRGGTAHSLGKVAWLPRGAAIIGKTGTVNDPNVCFDEERLCGDNVDDDLDSKTDCDDRDCAAECRRAFVPTPPAPAAADDDEEEGTGEIDVIDTTPRAPCRKWNLANIHLFVSFLRPATGQGLRRLALLTYVEGKRESRDPNFTAVDLAKRIWSVLEPYAQRVRAVPP